MIAMALALAKLSFLHARRWTNPTSIELAPITPLSSAYINMKLVAGLPPKSENSIKVSDPS